MQEIVELLHKSVRGNKDKNSYRFVPSTTYRLGDIFKFNRYQDVAYIILGNNDGHYYTPIIIDSGIPTGECHVMPKPIIEKTITNHHPTKYSNNIIYEFNELLKSLNPLKLVGTFVLKGEEANEF